MTNERPRENNIQVLRQQARIEGWKMLNEDTHVVHDFVTEEEAQTLIDWANSVKDQVKIKSRLKSDDAPGERRAEFIGNLPDAPMALIKEIMARAATKFGIEWFSESPYRPRIVFHSVGADTREHVDPHGGVNARHHMARFGEDESWRCDQHYKGNLVLVSPDSGGEFMLIDKPQGLKARSIIGFWGGIPHSVSRVEAGERILLTFGWCKNIEEPTGE
jgi:hypothetical protein